MLARVEGVTDLALTTNGLLLEKQAGPLASAGLRRVTVSLDTLKPERFKTLTRSARHSDVLRGIAAAREAGFRRIKLNAVIIRGFNEDELVDLVEFGRQTGAEVRFIEYMDVGGATHWTAERVFGRSEMLTGLAAHFGEVISRPRSKEEPAAPAEEFLLPDGTAFGIIASTTAPFCRDCDRSRLTADGVWFLCLYAEQGLDLRRLLRSGATDKELMSVIMDAWAARSDRGAEERAALESRGALYQIERLRADPHREMHTRGG
jgi:cyclic pyranopterin phosphate synthase